MKENNALPDRLTDDDIETIRIHLNAFKEKLCNQQRWNEAQEYQNLIDRFMSFVPTQPEPLTDTEQRIFLSAMGREENICRNVDTDRIVCLMSRNNLVTACHEITRKVKAALWRRENQNEGNPQRTQGIKPKTVIR